MYGVLNSGGSRTLAVLVIAFLALVAATQSYAAQSYRTEGWSTYRNERYGFSISYPGGLFVPDGERGNDSGQLFLSTDGAARLLVGALTNDEALSLDAYREFVKRETYPTAKFDYERSAKTWFVVSGTREGDHFYQRVTYVCGGRVINSWAMTYPSSQKRKYDPLVEVISRTFRPGSRGTEGCR